MKYYTITDEMVGLGLSPYGLHIFAILRGFSQGGQGCYYGSLPYLAQLAGCSLRTVQREIARMVDAGLLERGKITVNGTTRVALAATEHGDKMSPRGASECHPVGRQNVTPCGDNLASIPIIYKYNNKNNNTLSNERDNAHTRETSPRFVKPTQEEVRNYICDRNSIVDPEAFYAYYESNGWKVGRTPMKDWHAAVVTWEKRERARRKEERRPQSESVFEHNLRVLDSIGGTNYHEELYGPATNED